VPQDLKLRDLGEIEVVVAALLPPELTGYVG